MTVEERIYREIVQETGLPLEKVRKIVRSQFLLGVKENMKYYEEIQLQYFGKFYPLESRLEKHNKVRKDEHNK